MRDYVNIGSSPCDEPCVQLGAPNYGEESRKECQRYIDLIRKVCGEEPEGAELRTKSFPHDFGTYREVVCYFDDEFPDSVDYAFFVEGNSPETWKDKVGSKKWAPSISKKDKFQVIQEFYGFQANEKTLEQELDWLNDLRHPVTNKRIWVPRFMSKEEMRKWLNWVYDLFKKED